MSPQLRNDVLLSSLEAVRQDIETQLNGVSRYRALLTIEKTMGEVSDLDEVVDQLSGIRDHIRTQLNETAEYRALCAIEKIVPELSGVLALLAGRSDEAKAEAAVATDPDTLAPTQYRVEDVQPVEPGRPANANADPQNDVVQDDIVVVTDSAGYQPSFDTVQPAQSLADSFIGQHAASAAVETPTAADAATNGEALGTEGRPQHPNHDGLAGAAPLPADKSPPAPLAQSLAQLLGQSPPADTRNGAETTPFDERSSQAGRAA